MNLQIKQSLTCGAAFCGMFLLLSGAANAGDVPERDLTYFLRRLRTVDHLPELDASHTAMSSTWNRSGDNNDRGDFKNIVMATAKTPAYNVLLDTEGPGCVHRIVTGMLPGFVGKAHESQHENLKKTRLQVFLDRSETPIFDMSLSEFFDDANGPFPYPLTFRKTFPGTLFPIPFAKHCLVRLVNENYGKPGWDDIAWGIYWQVVHTRYSTPIKSLVWPPNEAEKKEIEATSHAWLKAESRPAEEPAQWTTDQTTALEPGKSMVVDLQGSGVIRQMRISVEPATPEVLRNTRLRIVWDGTGKPSVDVPVGHFFGHAYSGHGKTFTSGAAWLKREMRAAGTPRVNVEYSGDYNSLLLGVTPTEAYSRFPMPFAKGATVTIENRSGIPIENLRLKLDVEPLATLPPNWGRFHTTWAEAPAATDQSPGFGPKQIKGTTLLTHTGRGKYVGAMISVDWPHAKKWWGEGDVLIWTDEEGWPPSYHGTGSEEYFNSGWCTFDRKAISGFVTTRPGHPTVFSFHLNDAFQFQQNIQVVAEQVGAAGGQQVIDKSHPLWTTTAYWYADPAQPAGSD
jgi:hypothetical protein